jgi:hypothetical protein
MADKIVSALVTKPTFINNVLHLPGEMASVNLTELGVKSLDEAYDDGDAKGVNKTPGLEPLGKDGEMIEQVQVAAVAPHAPNPVAPQGIPPGTVTSGTGRLMSPAGPDTDDLAREMVGPAVDAAPLTPEEARDASAKASKAK